MKRHKPFLNVCLPLFISTQIIQRGPIKVIDLDDTAATYYSSEVVNAM